MKRLSVPNDIKLGDVYAFYQEVAKLASYEVDDETGFNPRYVMVSEVFAEKMLVEIAQWAIDACNEPDTPANFIADVTQYGASAFANHVYLQYGPTVDINNEQQLGVHEVLILDDDFIS